MKNPPIHPKDDPDLMLIIDAIARNYSRLSEELACGLWERGMDKPAAISLILSGAGGAVLNAMDNLAVACSCPMSEEKRAAFGNELNQLVNKYVAEIYA